MNKQYEMGKTMFEVMKMRKNNKQNPFPLRKYYGAMIIGFVFFLGIMAYYSATFRQRRDQAKQEVSLEEESIGANNSATQEKTKTTTQDKKETETTAQMKRTMSESVTYNGTSKLTWPIKGNIILATVDHHIRFCTGRLHIKIMHWLHGGKILINNSLHISSPLFHISGNPSEDTLICISLHIDLNVQKLSHSWICQQKNSLYQDHRFGIDP